MNKRLISIILTVLLTLPGMVSLAESTVPPTVLVPTAPVTTGLPGLDTFIMGSEEPEVPEDPEVPDDPEVPEEPEVPDVPDDGDSDNNSGNQNNKPTNPTVPPVTDEEEIEDVLEDGFGDADPSEVKELTLEWIDQLIDQSKTGAQNEVQDIRYTMNALIEKAIEAFGAVEISTNSTGNYSIEESALLKIAVETAAFAQTLESDASNMLVKKVEKIVTLEMDNSSVSATSVTLPALEKVFENVDAIVIKSNSAEIKIDKSSLSNLKDVQMLTIGMVKVEQLPEEVKGKHVLEFTINNASGAVTKFAKPIEISIPYVLESNSNANQLTAFYLGADGKRTPVPGVYEDGFFRFKTNHFSRFFIFENVVAFKDVKAGSWSKTYIESMAAKGVIAGKGHGIFDPQANVTRAEFITLLSHVLNYGEQSADIKYADVKSSDWYYPGVVMLYNLGIISSDSAVLKPNEAIDREEMGVLIGKTLSVMGYAAGDVNTMMNFSDYAGISVKNIKDVAAAVDHGILEGAYGKYSPNDKMTREQAAVVIYKLLYK